MCFLNFVSQESAGKSGFCLPFKSIHELRFLLPVFPSGHYFYGWIQFSFQWEANIIKHVFLFLMFIPFSGPNAYA